MNIRNKIILTFLLLLIPILVTGGFSYWGLKMIEADLNKNVVTGVNDLRTATKLNSLAQNIKYYDEVLTQSARNYAFTAEEAWKIRYQENSSVLEENIQQAIVLGDEEDKKIFANIEMANNTLVDMEEKAINLVTVGQKQTAVGILESEEYLQQKKRYQEGLMKYFSRQGERYESFLAVSTQSVDKAVIKIRKSLSQGAMETIVSMIITCILALGLGIMTASQISRPITGLIKMTQEIARGNLNARSTEDNNNEIGKLAKAFNQMTDKLKLSQQGIEAKVAERTAELEKTNQYMTGRELKMIELKKEIERLETELRQYKKP